jgi:hypothetical protein
MATETDAAPTPAGAIVAHVGGGEAVDVGAVTVLFSRPDGTPIGAPQVVTAPGTVTLADAPADTMVTALYDKALVDFYVTVTGVQPGETEELDYPSGVRRSGGRRLSTSLRRPPHSR